MDWIKQNYDKLLLAVFGFLALIIGGCQSFKAFSTATVDPPKKVDESKYEAGPYLTDKAIAAQAAIGAKVKWEHVKLSEHEKVFGFTAVPMVETGTPPPFPWLKPDSTQLHSPVPNWWLYENGIDFTVRNAPDVDDDGDLFTNKEEFQGGSNPRDPSSKPKITMKLLYVERVEVPYTIRFSAKLRDELQIRRDTPMGPEGRRMGKLNYKVGDVIFEDDKRFKITAVEVRPVAKGAVVEQVDHLILEDTLKPGSPPVVIPVRSTVNVPSYRAKIKSSLSPDVVVVEEGGEIKLKDFPGISFILKKILEDSIEIDYTEPGKPAATDKLPLSTGGAAPAPATADASSAAAPTPPAATTPPTATPPTATPPPSTSPSTAPPSTAPPATPPTPTTPPSPNR